MPCQANIKHFTIGKVPMVAWPLATGFWLLVKAILPEASSQRPEAGYDPISEPQTDT
jgi:hypothetical protein